MNNTQYSDIGFILEDIKQQVSVIIENDSVDIVEDNSTVIVYGYFIAKGGKSNEDILKIHKIKNVKSEVEKKVFCLEEFLSQLK